MSEFLHELAQSPPPEAEAALILDIDGFEGPLDLLLNLARVQKVDLRRISILALADQYLTFITSARQLELDLAADYLVMASWLAYLKSKLLLPEPEAAPGPSGEELAQRLAFRLQRLEAMREAATRLFARDRLGRDVFARGAPEPVEIVKTANYSDNIYDLLKAYTAQRVKAIPVRLKVVRVPVLAIEDARKRLERMLGIIVDWSSLDQLIPEEFALGSHRRSGLASTFLAMLEMAKDGKIELQQAEPLGPLYVRRRAEAERLGSET
ncbi:MAG: segregation/condensation protein A [Alphaproteobacteria bacterium]|nr:segregation/condensation protein A [Alphaproteobacteria bacterium]